MSPRAAYRRRLPPGALQRWLLRLCGLAAALVPLQALPADRATLIAERDRLEARFAAEQAQCSERFVVTACVDDVRRRRREALASVRAQLMNLDDAERRRRAEERRLAVQDKQRRAAERPAPVDAPASASVRAREPVPHAAPPLVVDHEAARREAAAEAARRAQASQRRRAEIEAGQARIAERQAARGSRPADPLPVPPLPPASAGR